MYRRETFFHFVLIAVLLIGFAGCEGGAKKKQLPPTHHKVGEKIKIDNKSLTISKVTRDWKSNDEFFVPAKEGKEYIVINVIMTNDGRYPDSANGDDFFLQDSKKVKFAERAPFRHRAFPTKLILPSHDRASADLAFTVPLGKSDLSLVYRPKSAKTKAIKTFIIKL